MEEQSILTETLNYFSLGLSLVLLLATAYLWSKNNKQDTEIKQLRSDLQRVKKTLSALEGRVREIREPKIISDVPEAEPFGLDLDEHKEMRITPLAPQKLWLNFVKDYNEFAEALASPGQLKKCEKFVRENNLKILTYSSSANFRPAIDVKDSIYWAYRSSGNEFAVVPNPMNPCDEEIVEFGGMKELYELNYQDGVYRKYFVKLPALLRSDPLTGWTIKNTGVLNLER